MATTLTREQIALEHGLCTCDPIYTSRGMKAPDCPWHAYEVETAMEAYGRQEAIEFDQFAREKAKWHQDVNRYCLKDFDGAYCNREDLYDLYLTYKNKNNG